MCLWIVMDYAMDYVLDVVFVEDGRCVYVIVMDDMWLWTCRWLYCDICDICAIL